MPSKGVIDRQKRSLLIIAAGRENRDKIARSAHKLLGEHLGRGEKVPDVGEMVELAVRSLEHAVVVMLDCDEAHARELGDDDEPRERRDRGTQVLVATLGDLREILAGLFGSAALVQVGLDVATPRDPAMASAFTREVTGRLRSASFPQPRIAGARVSVEEWAKRLDRERAELDQALKDVARELREAETTLVAKNAAVAAHDEQQRRVAALLSGLLELCGETELAERVRPPVRSPRGRKNDGGAGVGDDTGGDGTTGPE